MQLEQDGFHVATPADRTREHHLDRVFRQTVQDGGYLGDKLLVPFEVSPPQRVVPVNPFENDLIVARAVEANGGHVSKLRRCFQNTTRHVEWQLADMRVTPSLDLTMAPLFTIIVSGQGICRAMGIAKS